MSARWRGDVLALCAGALAGAVVLGVGGRAVMALLALLTGGSPAFTWGGTLDVVFVGAGYGLLGGLLLAILRRVPPRSPGARGVLLGVGLLVLAWATSPVGRATARTAAAPVPAVLAGAAAAFVVYGLAAEALRRGWDRTPERAMDSGPRGGER